MTQPRRGGRRHGLDEQGEAQRLKLSLSQADRARLEELAEAWGCSLAEAARRAIRQARAR